MSRRIGKKDITLLVVIAIVLICVFIGFQVRYSHHGNSVTILMDGEIYGVYDLGEDQEIEINGSEGTTNILVIEDGYANMISADCPDKLCVKQKAISADGETIVCLPHKVVVEVDSIDNQSEFDAIAQ